MTPRECNELYTGMREDGESRLKKRAFKRNFCCGYRVMVFCIGLGRNLLDKSDGARKYKLMQFCYTEEAFWCVIYRQHWQT
jgi:hypothetical protein